MTDPYKYLFQKLGIESIYNAFYKTQNSAFNETQNIYVDLIPLIVPLSRSWNAKSIFFYLRNINANLYDIDVVKLTELLKLFPAKLESKEHVDLLLTLNGMNKGA